MNNSQAVQEGRVEVSHGGQVASVPLLKQPGLSLVLAPGPWRRTLMGYVQDLAGEAVIFFEAPRKHCCAMLDAFDEAAVEVTVGSAMFRVSVEHLAVVRRAIRC